MRKFLILILIFGMFIPGCSGDSFPTPSEVLSRFVALWEAGGYDQMYDMLTETARQRTDRDTFVERYRLISEGIGLESLGVAEVAGDEDGERRELTYTLAFTTSTVPEFTQTYSVFMEQGEESWLLDWDHEHIFPVLTADLRVRVERVRPERGSIYDRNGMPLAYNGEVVRIGLEPRFLNDEDLPRLSELVGPSVDSIERSLSEGWVQPDSFVPIRTMRKELAEEIRDELASIPGVHVRASTGRLYDIPESLATTIGYMAPLTAERLAQLEQYGYRSSDQAGMLGLEYVFERELAGEFGYRIFLVDPNGRDIGTIVELPVVGGKDIQTTLDIDLQLILDEQMAGQQGSALAMNYANGEIIAVVSNPGFDSNLFSLGISSAEYNAIVEQDSPFLNRTFNGIYAPGSTFKPFTALMGLAAGSLDPTEAWDTPREWQTIRRVERPAGEVDLRAAMKYSDNVYFANAVDAIGWDKFLQYSEELGFGIDFSFALNSRSSQIKADDRSQRHLRDLSYGQGQMLVTPLHLSTMYALIARQDGALPAPVIIQGAVSEPWLTTDFAVEDLALLDEVLLAAAADPQALAWAGSEGVRGKTGTAEVSATRQLGWYVSYFDELVLTICLEGEPPLGSQEAVSIARGIIAEMRN